MSGTVTTVATNATTPVVVTGTIASQLPVLGSQAWSLASSCYQPLQHHIVHLLSFEKKAVHSVKLPDIASVTKALTDFEGVATLIDFKLIVEFDGVGQKVVVALSKEALATNGSAMDIKQMANYRQMVSGVNFSTENDITPQTPPTGTMQVKGVPIVGDTLYLNVFADPKSGEVTLKLTAQVLMMGIKRTKSSQVFK